MNCVTATATVVATAPAACTPGYMRVGRIHGTDVATGSHQCQAAKNRARLYVEQHVGAACHAHINVAAGACVAVVLPGNNC